jgi:hypothetical protein
VFVPTSPRARVLCLAVALTAAASPALARAGFWPAADARAELAALEARAETLADRDDTILRRIRIKEELVADLVAGRATLADVSAQFLELNADEPVYLDVLRATVPGDSDAERAARNVVEYAVPRADPAARPELRRRLEAELLGMQSVR